MAQKDAGEPVPNPVMTAPRAARSTTGIVWQCESNFIVCQHDHLMRLHETGYRADLRRMQGHAFLMCSDCEPATYFFAHFVTQPYPMATCYAIDKASYLEFDKGDESPSTPELLYRLRDPRGQSYNPNWRPPR